MQSSVESSTTDRWLLSGRCRGRAVAKPNLQIIPILQEAPTSSAGGIVVAGPRM